MKKLIPLACAPIAALRMVGVMSAFFTMRG